MIETVEKSMFQISWDSSIIISVTLCACLGDVVILTNASKILIIKSKMSK